MKAFILLSYLSIASISAAILTPALPAIAQTYSLMHGEVMAVVSWFLFGYVFGQLMYGPLANRYGGLYALRIGLVINLLSIGLAGIAVHCHSFHLLLIARVIMAIGSAAGLACGMILIHEYCQPEKAAKLLTYAIISFTLGIGIAVTLAGFITQYCSWVALLWVLLVHGIVMLLSTLIFEKISRQTQTISIKNIIRQYREALGTPSLIGASLVVGLCSIISYCYSAAAPMIAEQNFHLSPAAYGSWNSINMLGMLASGFLARLLMHRVGAQRLIAFAIMAVVLTIAMLALLYQYHWLTVGLFFCATSLLYLFAGLLFPAGSWLALAHAQNRASASAMMSFINMGSACIAVVGMGLLPGVIFWQYLVIMLIALMLIVLSNISLIIGLYKRSYN